MNVAVGSTEPLPIRAQTHSCTSAHLNVAVVGAGRWGAKIIDALSGFERCRITQICDSDISRLAPYGSSSAIRLARCFEETLCNADVTALVIATPPETHADLVIAGLRAGKHVFIEKPMALSSHDARRIVGAAELAQRLVLVGHLLRYHPAIADLVNQQVRGELGDVYHFTSRRLGLPRPSTPAQTWWELAPHDVSLANAFLRGSPVWIAARRSASSNAVRARLIFPHGASAELFVGRHERRITRITLFATAAVCRFDEFASHATLKRYFPAERKVHRSTYPNGINGAPAGAGHTPSLRDPLRVELNHFIESILLSRPPLTDCNEGARVVAVLEAGARSLEEDGKWMRVPPVILDKE